MASGRRWSGMEFMLLAVFGLLAVGGLWTGVRSAKRLRHVAVVAVRVAETSGQFKEQVGAPLRVGFVSGRMHGGDEGGTADLKIPVSGPKGSGVLRGWLQSGVSGWRVCSLTFHPKAGQDLVIVADVTATCERE